MIQQNYDYKALVTNVVDGDTLDLVIDLGFYVLISQRIRLNSIDTKEINSQDPEERELAQRAKSRLSDLVLNKAVMLRSYKKDKYGRFLGDIYLGNELINYTLISEGLAVVYDGGKRS